VPGFDGAQAIEHGRELGEQGVVGIDDAPQVSLLRRPDDEPPIPKAAVVGAGVAEVGEGVDPRDEFRRAGAEERGDGLLVGSVGEHAEGLERGRSRKAKVRRVVCTFDGGPMVRVLRCSVIGTREVEC
jgi:hypothetical protein